MRNSLPAPIEVGAIRTALAPMQNVTDHAFLHVVAEIGPPDYFFTEYLSVHSTTSLDGDTLRSITENRTGRPIYAQVLGNDPADLAKAAEALEAYEVAGVDLNLGCPAPKIYKRNAGGGLLRDPVLVDEIIAAMRERISGSFSVKCRLGFGDDAPFEACVDSVARHGVDFLTIHGRTVKQMYRGEVDYESMKRAVSRLDCPVFANGNLTSAKVTELIMAETGCHGAMIGRGAIRNPWIFRQIRDRSKGRPVFQPTLLDVRDYIEKLNRAKFHPNVGDRYRIAHLKRYLIFIGEGIDPDGNFLFEARRVKDEAELFRLCDRHLVDGGNGEKFFSDEPFPGVVARPNQE
ncbi:MAG: tRNA dihydrouridine synthase [Puniceicoccales bacterium]